MTNYSGLPMNGYTLVFDNITDFRTAVGTYVSSQTVTTDAIYNCFVVPKKCFNPAQFSSIVPELFIGQDVPINDQYTVDKPVTIDGYTPKNQKLLTFPYCYLLVSNNLGSSNVLHYEKFRNSNCPFYISCVPTVGGSIKCFPEEYGTNETYVEEEGILAGKYPVLNWNKDNYGDWLITNSSTLATQKAYGGVTAGLGILGAIATLALGIGSGGSLLPVALGFLGSTATAISGGKMIDQAIATDKEHSLIPDSSAGLCNGGDINFCSGATGFFFYHCSIKKEFAEIIDGYFDMYGYKVNSLEIPRLSTRINWNYLKILAPNVEGRDIPEKDMNKYKEMLQTGITFWHNPQTFRDYSQDNGNS